jgi:hypothetical protein
MNFKVLLLFCSISTLFLSCQSKFEADSLFYNGNVYTLDSSFTVKQAFAVKDGRIMEVGSDDEILKFSSKEKVDLKGKYVYPGFNDAHSHFYGYGVDLQKTWLIGTTSFDAIVDTLAKYKERRFMGWIFGRGWDQNDWINKSFPDKTKLDSLFPDVPVFLMRIDGHAALVNQVALDLAGITAQTKVDGGELILNNGKLTGLLIDNAVDLVKLRIPEPTNQAQKEALIAAQNNCFEVGLTSLSDAGLDYTTILLIDSLQKEGKLKMRINAMVKYDSLNVDYYKKHGKYKSDHLNVSSFKVYADGALGSRGACLLHAYSDQKMHFGFLLHPVADLDEAASTAADLGFQLNTHCIGDSANRLLLNIYSKYLKGKNDFRWRIEHAQIVNESDFNLFSKYSIIPSVQPSHATSDMYWAKDRIGKERIKGAYAYKTLLNYAGLLAGGSDFPVEDINPLFGFYAAVSRKDQHNFPEGGFQKENAISRVEALKAMTIWPAFASFEENVKGSLEPNKFADFVILNEDLLNAPEQSLFNIKVQQTYSSGKEVFNRKKD